MSTYRATLRALVRAGLVTEERAAQQLGGNLTDAADERIHRYSDPWDAPKPPRSPPTAPFITARRLAEP